MDKQTWFENTTETKLIKGGFMEVHCKRGNWSVCGAESEKDRVESEAFHYWIQYFNDGDYNDMIFNFKEK